MVRAPSVKLVVYTQCFPSLRILLVYYCTRRMSACAQVSKDTPYFLGVAGDGPAVGKRLLFHPRIPTLAETSPRRIWVESTMHGGPADRDEGAKGQTSIPAEISAGMRHGPPYVLYGDDLGYIGVAQNSGCRSRQSTESD